MSADYRGRRPANPGANVLPVGASRKKAPAWPLGTASASERALWVDLWARPVAHLWRSLHIPPIVPARYVRVVLANPASGSLAQMESGLGLTPAALKRLSVTFEEVHPTLSDEAERILAAARERLEAER
jgi:hypothetical protein